MEYLDTLRRHWFPLCRSCELGARPLADTVIVDGRVVVRGGALLTGDEEAIARELAEVALR